MKRTGEEHVGKVLMLLEQVLERSFQVIESEMGPLRRNHQQQTALVGGMIIHTSHRENTQIIFGVCLGCKGIEACGVGVRCGCSPESSMTLKIRYGHRQPEILPLLVRNENSLVALEHDSIRVHLLDSWPKELHIPKYIPPFVERGF